MDVPPLHTQQLPSPLQGLKSGAALSEWYLPRRDWNLFHDPSYVERLNVLLQSCQEEVRIHSAKGGDQHKARELRENAIPLLEKLLHLANKPPDMLLVLLRVPEEHWKVPAKSSAAVSPVSSRRLGRGPSRNSAGIQAASSAHDAGDEMHEEMMSPTGAGRFNTSGGSTSSTAAHHQEHHHHHPSDLERQNNEPLLFYVHREIFAALNPVIKSEIKLWDRLEELHLKYGAGCERVCRMLYGEAWEKWVNYAYQSKAFDTKDDDGRSSFRSVSRSLHVDVREGVGDDLPSSDNILVDKNGAPGQITKGSTLYAASTEHDDDSHRGSPADDGFDRDTARDEDPASSTINNTSSVVIGKRHHHRHHVKQEQLDFVPSGKVDLTELAHEDRSGRGVKPTAQAVIDKQLAQLRRLHRCVIRGTQTRLGELFYKRVVVQSGPARIRSRLTARGVEHALHYLYNRGATRDSASGESWDHIPSDDFPSALHFLFQLAVTEKTMLEALRALLYQRPQIGCLYLARQYGYDKTRTQNIPKTEIMARKNLEYLNLENVILSAFGSYSGEDVQRIRGYSALSDEDKIDIAERRIGALEGLVREPHIRFRTHFRDMLPPGTIEDKPLLPLSTGQRLARGRGFSHHFALQAEKEKLAEQAKRQAEEAEAERKAQNRELYFRPRSKSAAFALYDSSLDNFTMY